MATPPVFSAGAVLTAAQMNGVGLWLIKTQTFTSTANCDVTSCFNSDYENYRIVLSNMNTAAAADIHMRLLNGTTPTTANYYSSMTYSTGSYAAPTSLAFVTQNGGANTYFLTGAVTDTTNRSGLSFDLFGPNTATITTMTGLSIDARTTGNPLRMTTGFLNDTTAYTGIRVFSVGGSSFTNLTVRVYGYRN